MRGGKAIAKNLIDSDSPDIELINEKESKETFENSREDRLGKMIKFTEPKWSLLEVTLRGRNLIWCLGQPESGRVFRIKTLDIDAHGQLKHA
jgi:hypothetical protein